MFKKLCVIGVGLIGGSIARAVRERHPQTEIIGFGRFEDRLNLQMAEQLGVIDAFSFDIKNAVTEADCVVIAVPVGSYSGLFELLKPYWSEQTIYTDAGSTKGSVIEACRSVFGVVPDNFIPAHPIAGAEQSGVSAANADLFKTKRVILTPLETTNAQALAQIQQFWETMGALISVMTVEQHDAILAATSHLPHILAFTLVELLGRKDEQADIFKYAAGGFKDFTRIASSDPTMWLDICLANKDQIAPLIRQLKAELGKIQHYIEVGDAERLFETFSYAGKARQRFLDQFETQNQP